MHAATRIDLELVMYTLLLTLGAIRSGKDRRNWIIIYEKRLFSNAKWHKSLRNNWETNKNKNVRKEVRRGQQKQHKYWYNTSSRQERSLWYCHYLQRLAQLGMDVLSKVLHHNRSAGLQSDPVIQRGGCSAGPFVVIVLLPDTWAQGYICWLGLWKTGSLHNECGLGDLVA